MRFETFELERWQSLHEHHVGVNLSESGVHPLTVRELLALPGEEQLDPQELLDMRLGYPQTNGEDALRERIASLYEGATAEHVLVTHGGAEANLLVALSVVEPKDRVVMLTPNYLQTRGIARGLAAEVVEWPIREELGWHPDPDELDELTREGCALILLTTPNNPTGRILGDEVLDRVAQVAERCGAWVLSDEIYRGAELSGELAPSLWGRSKNLCLTAGLSKAYGLPGLRIGWVVSPDPRAIEVLWGRKDYTTITDSPLTQRLALHALEPTRRNALLGRTRGHLQENLERLLAWEQRMDGRVAIARPEAGAMSWLRYEHALDSAALSEKLRHEHDVLIVPGAHFGVEQHLRLGYGVTADDLEHGMQRLGAVLHSC